MNIPRTHMMDKEEYEEEIKIYSNADPINHPGVATETNKTRREQTRQQTGSDCVRKRSSRSAPVCLALLCFLLMTVVVVLRLHFCTNNTHYTHERNQLLTRITNNTEERDELLTRITNLTKERDELLTRITNLTKERDELQTRNSDATKEGDEQRTRNIQLTKEKDELLSNNLELIKQRDQEKDERLKMDGWIYYKSSFYFISSEEKSWTGSRRYCTDRGADLIIINDSDEQNFLIKISASAKVWIGLNDRAVEGRWKWVDDSAVTIRLWNKEEPGGGTAENCVLNEPGWADYPCTHNYKWVCEKNIL